MSRLLIVQLVCDGPDCSTAYPAPLAEIDDIVAQRRSARQTGWVRWHNRDLCPECVTRAGDR